MIWPLMVGLAGFEPAASSRASALCCATARFGNVRYHTAITEQCQIGVSRCVLAFDTLGCMTNPEQSAEDAANSIQHTEARRS